MKWSTASNGNKKLKSLIVFLLTLGASFILLPHLLLAQTGKLSPLNFEEDLEIFNEGPVNEDTEENPTTTQNDSNEKTSAPGGPISEAIEEDELGGVENEALSEDEPIGNNQQTESLIDTEVNSDILTDDENEGEVAETNEEEPTENTAINDEDAIAEAADDIQEDIKAIEDITSDSDENEEEIVQADEEDDTPTTEDIAINDDESEEETPTETSEADEEDDTQTTEDIAINDDESEEETPTETSETDDEDDTQTTEDIATSYDESEEETTEISEVESIEQDEFADIEDEILSEDEQSENTQQAESLIDSEVNTENDNVLSQTVAQAEEAGLSISFIKLPFEETKEERLARLQQDEYFDELIYISQTGVHQYKVTTSRMIGSVGLNLGFFPAPSLSVDNLTYEDIYGNNSNIAFFLSYEWKFLKKVGALSLIPEIGFSWANGRGRFAPDSIHAGETPKEKYTLLVIPVGAALMYRLQYWENQIFLPFAIGGASYFVLLETRDDFDVTAPKETLAVAATPALYFGGGIQFSLDSLSQKAINTLDREFGINHIYLVAEVRQYIGLSNNLNFSGFVVSGGIRVDF